jgi:hypothetical protein
MTFSEHIAEVDTLLELVRLMWMQAAGKPDDRRAYGAKINTLLDRRLDLMGKRDAEGTA